MKLSLAQLVLGISMSIGPSAWALPAAPPHLDGAAIEPGTGVLILQLDRRVIWNSRPVQRGSYRVILDDGGGRSFLVQGKNEVQAVVLPAGRYYLSGLEELREVAGGNSFQSKERYFTVPDGGATWAGRWAIETRLKEPGDNVHYWVQQDQVAFDAAKTAFPELFANGTTRRGTPGGWLWPLAVPTMRNASRIGADDPARPDDALLALLLEPIVSSVDGIDTASVWTLELVSLEDGERWALKDAQRPSLWRLPAGRYLVERATSNSGGVLEDLAGDRYAIEIGAGRLCYSGTWRVEPRRNRVEVRFERALLDALLSSDPTAFVQRPLWLCPAGQPARALGK